MKNVRTSEPLYGTKSWCHKSPSLIVRSRDGGFVTQNCLVCQKPRGLPPEAVPGLLCPNCGIDLEKMINVKKNYSYTCNSCDLSFQLADIVPHWSDRFEYYGYAIDSEFIDEHQKRQRK